MPRRRNSFVNHCRGKIECPTCDSPNVGTEYVEQSFKYGVGDDAEDIGCTVPLRVCRSCGTQFIDEEGERARHEAVCRHLGLMTPAEVQAVRDRYAATQAEFSELTGIGEASLSRWENGSSLQSKAYDNFLYLLTSGENYRRLMDRAATTRPSASSHVGPGKFRSLHVNAICIAHQRQFVLRPTG
jgi:putative zinc finger/helix-turn-helix YgiT family protein